MKKTKTLSTFVLVLGLMFAALSPAAADSHVGGAATITSPAPETYVLADTVTLAATYTGTSSVLNWAARVSNCEFGGTNMAAMGPNVTDDLDDVISHSYVNGEFTAVLDVSGWEDGAYCFVFNPGGTTDADRATMTFYIAKEQRTKDACKDGGWATFGSYENQGECVSEFARAK